MGFCACSMICYALLCVLSSFVIILMGMRELFASLYLSSWCLMIVMWLFLTMLLVDLWCVILVFPDQTHLLFCIYNRTTIELFCHNKPSLAMLSS